MRRKLKNQPEWFIKMIRANDKRAQRYARKHGIATEEARGILMQQLDEQLNRRASEEELRHLSTDEDDED